MSNRTPKRGVEATEPAKLPAKRRHKPTQRLLESQRQLTPPRTQSSQPSQRQLSPIEPPLSPSLQTPLPIGLRLTASPAVDEAPWETQVRDNRPASALLAPEEGSIAATEASSEPGVSVNALFEGLSNNFTGLD